MATPKKDQVRKQSTDWSSKETKRAMLISTIADTANKSLSLLSTQKLMEQCHIFQVNWKYGLLALLNKVFYSNKKLGRGNQKQKNLIS